MAENFWSPWIAEGLAAVNVKPWLKSVCASVWIKVFWVCVRSGWEVVFSSSGLQDRMKYCVRSASWTKGLFVHTAAERAKVQRPFNNHFVLNLQWISRSVLHFSFCLLFLFSTSLSLLIMAVQSTLLWPGLSLVQLKEHIRLCRSLWGADIMVPFTC